MDSREAITPASITVPAWAMMSPTWQFSPWCRIWVRSWCAVVTTIRSGRATAPAGTLVSSTGTTMSPSVSTGVGAPVIMRTAVPGATSTGVWPAGMSPLTGNSHGPLPAGRSAVRTKNPSMAELENGGTGRFARASAARTSPADSSVTTVRVAVGLPTASTAARWSDKLRNGTP